MLRAVRDFQHLRGGRQSCGTSSSPSARATPPPRLSDSHLDIFDVQPCVTFLPYFGSDAISSTVWELFKNASAACGHKIEDFSFETAPKELRFMLEDTLGWSFAVVQLGAVYAFERRKLEGIAKPEPDFWDQCREDIHESMVERQYNGSFNRFSVARGGSFSSSALSPYTVSEREEESRERRVCKLFLCILSHFLTYSRTCIPQISCHEPIPGKKLENLSQLGLVDLQEDKGSKVKAAHQRPTPAHSEQNQRLPSFLRPSCA